MGNRYATARCAGEGGQQPANLPPLPPLTAGEGGNICRSRVRGGRGKLGCIPCYVLAWNVVQCPRDQVGIGCCSPYSQVAMAQSTAAYHTHSKTCRNGTIEFLVDKNV